MGSTLAFGIQPRERWEEENVIITAIMAFDIIAKQLQL
jgi:hypothetical protein